MIRGAALFALLAWGGVARAQTPRILLRDTGPGDGGDILRAVLAQPYHLVPPAGTPYVVPRDSAVRGPLVVLGRDAVIDGTVDGDIVVVAGDLYTHPGGRVTGGAVTFGGGIYESALATIAGTRTAFRDFTYDIEPIDGGFALSYRSVVVRSRSAFEWAGPLGFVMPSYDRTDGLTLPIAADFPSSRSGIDFEPGVAYRTELGAFDPSATATLRVGQQSIVELSAQHATFTNDSWIRPDLVNSAATLVLGDDMRNYFRATRVEGTASRRWDIGSRSLEPFVGVRWERASSVRPDSAALGGPWSVSGRDSRDDMLRPNPRIDDGDISSLLAGAALTWKSGPVSTESRLDVEVGRGARMLSGPSSGATFAQTTLDARFTLDAFRGQRLRMIAHGVLTTAGQTPRQRWSYLGGPGSLATLDPLSLGGDELVYVDGEYDIPLGRVSLPLVGSPVVTLRDAIGGAGVRALPALDQALGVRISLSYLYVEALVDPAARRGILGLGFSASQ
ncbi:MAG: hypothetical protein ACHQWU_03170 [Gemmatimonadales bacterium]